MTSWWYDACHGDHCDMMFDMLDMAITVMGHFNVITFYETIIMKWHVMWWSKCFAVKCDDYLKINDI